MIDKRRAVCARYCSFYKPQKFVEPGCAGFLALDESLLALCEKAGLSPAPEELFGLDDCDPRLLEICAKCSYPPEGCDFRNPQTKVASPKPCGGLRVMAGLLSLGVQP